MEECVHFNFHVSFYPDSNSACESIYIARVLNPGSPERESTKVHELNRELLWAEGKALSMAFDFNKALDRFAEACSQLVNPF